MKVELRCEYCREKDLEETNVEGMFYCPCCDEEIHITECDIEILEAIDV